MNGRYFLTEGAWRAKSHLRELERLAAYIDQTGARLEELRQRLTSLRGVDYSQTRVQRGRVGDTVGGKVAMLADAEAEEKAALKTYKQRRGEIVAEINSLGNRHKSRALYMRYVEGAKFEAIARAMGYSYSGVRDLHDRALEDFAAIVLDRRPPAPQCPANRRRRDDDGPGQTRLF